MAEALRQALDDRLGPQTAERFEPYLEGLVRHGYTPQDLPHTSLDGLVRAGLTTALADRIIDAYKAPPPADTRETQPGTGLPQTFEGFKALLDGLPDEQVLQRAFELLPGQVQLAHSKQQAQWVYNRALQLPGSSTKLYAQQHGGVLINGDFLPNVVSRSALVYAFKDRVPVLLKIPSKTGAQHEAYVWEQLSTNCTSPPGLAGPIKLLSLQGHTGQKWGVQMPLYPATLQHMPKPVPPRDVLIIGQQVHAGLQHMHMSGWGHCDVKSPNIFVDAEGSAVLGDYGATRQLGQDADEKTMSHIAADLTAAGIDIDKASKQLDEYMLAVTLLERLGLLQLGAKQLTVAAVRQAALQTPTDDGQALLTFVRSLLKPIMP